MLSVDGASIIVATPPGRGFSGGGPAVGLSCLRGKLAMAAAYLAISDALRESAGHVEEHDRDDIRQIHARLECNNYSTAVYANDLAATIPQRRRRVCLAAVEQSSKLRFEEFGLQQELLRTWRLIDANPSSAEWDAPRQLDEEE